MAAQNLYTGELFKKARRLIELRKLEWWILSAKYGLTTPTQAISSYERTLQDMTNDDRGDWGIDVSFTLHNELNALGYVPTDTTIEIYAGALYFEAIAHRMTSRGYTILRPLEGLSIGLQLHYLKVRIESIEKDNKTEKAEAIKNAQAKLL